MFNCESHTRLNGECPFEEYREGVEQSGRKREAAKIDAAVDKLCEVGSYRLAEIDLAKKLNDVWELRPGKHRILYFWDETGMKYILLNGFRKATRKTPKQELERAERLRQEYLAQGMGYEHG